MAQHLEFEKKKIHSITNTALFCVQNMNVIIVCLLKHCDAKPPRPKSYLNKKQHKASNGEKNGMPELLSYAEG